MLYAVIGFGIAVAGLVTGYYLTVFVLQYKANKLMDTVKALYPKEMEIWRMGYRRGLTDLFHDE